MRLRVKSSTVRRVLAGVPVSMRRAWSAQARTMKPAIWLPRSAATAEVRDGRQEVAGAAGDAGVDGEGVAGVGREARVAWVFGGSCVHRSGRARQTMWA